jgi:hypothetical protein
MIPSSMSAKMCKDAIDNGVLSKLAARVCLHIKCNNKDVGDSNQINTFNPNFPRRGAAPSPSSSTPQWLIVEYILPIPTFEGAQIPQGQLPICKKSTNGSICILNSEGEQASSSIQAYVVSILLHQYPCQIWSKHKIPLSISS